MVLNNYRERITSYINPYVLEIGNLSGLKYKDCFGLNLNTLNRLTFDELKKPASSNLTESAFSSIEVPVKNENRHTFKTFLELLKVFDRVEDLYFYHTAGRLFCSFKIQLPERERNFSGPLFVDKSYKGFYNNEYLYKDVHKKSMNLCKDINNKKILCINSNNLIKGYSSRNNIYKNVVIDESFLKKKELPYKNEDTLFKEKRNKHTEVCISNKSYDALNTIPIKAKKEVLYKIDEIPRIKAYKYVKERSPYSQPNLSKGSFGSSNLAYDGIGCLCLDVKEKASCCKSVYSIEIERSEYFSDYNKYKYEDLYKNKRMKYSDFEFSYSKEDYFIFEDSEIISINFSDEDVPV